MTPENNILIVTPRMEELAALCRSNTLIEAGLYREYDVKRGLRDVNGKGVLAGLTNISDIIAQREVDGILQPCPGELYYRGIRIEELVQGFVREGRKGYEEVAYLLLFGRLPALPLKRRAICCCSVSCRMPSVWAISRLCWRRDARCRPISRATLS